MGGDGLGGDGLGGEVLGGGGLGNGGLGNGGLGNGGLGNGGLGNGFGWLQGARGGFAGGAKEKKCPHSPFIRPFAACSPPSTPG